MRVVFVAVAWVVAACAQQEDTGASPERKEEARLQALTDRTKAALASQQITEANKIATELQLAISRHEKLLNLADREAGLPLDGVNRYYALPAVAVAAADASDYAKAEAYATELLALAEKYPKDGNYGNAVFYGNMALGQVALFRDGNVAKAGEHLIASGRTPGSPTLNSFGPNMRLARDLLAAGERKPVLEFFNLCRAFWKGEMARRRLDEWIAVVNGCCRMPNFRPNLSYVP